MNSWERFSWRLIKLTVASLLLVVGCAKKTITTPTQLIEQPPPFSESGQTEPPDRWWSAFEMPELDAYISSALSNNFTLAAALDRVSAARALARREASDLFPDLNGIASSNGDLGPGENRGSLALGLDTSYQVDLWGEIGSRVEANRRRADATCADWQAVALILSTDLARTWFSLIEAHAQVELLEDQIKANRIGLELQESRFALGLIRSPDVLRQRQLLESTLEQSVVAESRIEILEHQLAVLLGEVPQTAGYEPGTKLPDLPPLPAAGMPMELLHRRPDVRSVYLELQAADYDLASSISSRYPRLNLSGSLLTIAEHPETLVRDWFVSVGAQLIAPLFDGRQRRSEVDRTAAVKCQRFNEYAQTMLTAFQEVEDSLAQEKYQVQRIKHLEEQVKLAGQSSDQLREQYLIQEAEYLDVLSALTAQQSLQRQLLSAQLQLVLIRVSLYLAIAGDFAVTPRLASSSLPIADEAESDDNSEADSDPVKPIEDGADETDEPQANPSGSPGS